MSQINPVNGRILVQAEDAPKQTPGGIVLPDQSRKSSTQGIVFAVGPGELLQSGDRVPPSVKPGDRVIFQRYSAIEVEIENETLLALTENDLIAVIRP